MAKTKKLRWIQHYNNKQKILLVGEGDFSFSACLARAFGSASNMVATSLDSQETLLEKHWSSAQHLDQLRKRDCLVLHRVDVHKMNKHRKLKNMNFDVIIFNFPHAGHVYGLCEKDEELIEMHRGLLGGFFKSASTMVGEGGQVHVTHRVDYPYSEWNLEELAKKAGLYLLVKVEFLKEDYPGYHNKRGGGINSNKTFPRGCAVTFIFSPIKDQEDMNKIEAAPKKTRRRRRKKIGAALSDLVIS